ncbi:ABC transporter substrate-binding protein [Actinomadura sp. HBU206391]|uniref:ABC transporter substrate-binding protein n=1 Tax=Actinomadura sp. HBU206391 TaxID=2731692 RepID=UPI001C9D58BB|nr:ABC transporter substrate-binding protein [Actinomadura sp. HBU206391]
MIYKSLLKVMPPVHGRRLPPGSRTSRSLRTRGRFALAAAVGAALVSACSGSDPGQEAVAPPIPVQQDIGPSEGRVNLVVWAGYAEDGSSDKTVDWVTPFTKATGCRVNSKVADTSDSMVALMKTGQYDGVSASGDASLRLIYGGDVAPVNTGLLSNYGDIAPYLKNQPYNSVKGQMYGVPHGYGANVLMYRTDKLPQRPTSWSVVWDRNSPAANHVTAYDSPIYIADAALYLKTHRPDLKITDVYELNEKQFTAAVDLLKQQRPSINQYWHSYVDELQSFKSADNYAGTAWEVTANLAKDEGVPVATTIPAEGATGWSDTWMISSKAEHPNCMYRWMNWITTPRAQAQVGQWFGQAPANPKACRYTESGFCTTYHVGDAEFYKRIAFWKTPVADCGDDRGTECVDYSRWAQAWTEIKG